MRICPDTGSDNFLGQTYKNFDAVYITAEKMS